MLRSSLFSRCASSSSSFTAASTASVVAAAASSTTATANNNNNNKCAKPMLSETRRKNLSHMYEIVGSHSAVKLCRWTKSSLRGQGGCYKYSAFGIVSHGCMESTPNVACANKCTFCWRLNTNPTMKEWNFQTDEPVQLVDQLVEKHKSMIWSIRGMPGVDPKHLEEAMKGPKHCALSLVGEPITYPRINEFTAELHRRGISSFLVNNGQFPDAIPALRPVTQFYLSIDAMEKKTMKELDRPIFPDFWERHTASIEHTSRRTDRTVFRVTCIDHINMDDADVERLANMVRRGKPGFIELKQMTPALQSRTTPLRIKNVPTWARMREFTLKLRDALRDEGFEVPIVHEHSHCFILARKSDYFDFASNKWKTWIDFDKFIELALRDPEGKSWTFRDYRSETPQWALLPTVGEIPEKRDERWQVEVDEETGEEMTVAAGGLGFAPGHKRRVSGKAKRAKEKKGESEVAAATAEAAAQL